MPDAPTDHTKLFAKSLSLAELQTQIVAFELGLGPIKALGRTADKTAATFKLDDPPAIPVKLVPGNGTPNGYDPVCSGGVWILGQPQTISAVRKRAEDSDESEEAGAEDEDSGEEATEEDQHEEDGIGGDDDN